MEDIIRKIQVKIDRTINEYFKDVNLEQNNKIKNSFLENEKISELQRPFLNIEILKHIVDNYPDLEITQSGKDEIKRIGLTEEEMKSYPKENIHFGAFKQSSKESIPVEYISSKMNNIFLHAFIDNEALRPEKHSPLSIKYPVSLKSQCDLIRATKGEISTSSAILTGHRSISGEFNNSYIGLVVSSGIITSASSKDSYTVLDDDGVRRGKVNSSSPMEIVQAMKARDSRNLSIQYNEIIVREPEIAGIYYKLDVFRRNNLEGKENSFQSFHYAPQLFNEYKEMMKAANSIEGKTLPLFAIHNGKISKMSINIDKLKEYCNFEEGNKEKALIFPRDESQDEDFNQKRKAWLDLSEKELIGSIFQIEEELTQDDLFKIGKNSSLDPQTRLTILKDNSYKLKSETIVNLYEKKINSEIKDTIFKNKISSFIKKSKSNENVINNPSRKMAM